METQKTVTAVEHLNIYKKIYKVQKSEIGGVLIQAYSISSICREEREIEVKYFIYGNKFRGYVDHESIDTGEIKDDGNWTTTQWTIDKNFAISVYNRYCDEIISGFNN